MVKHGLKPIKANKKYKKKEFMKARGNLTGSNRKPKPNLMTSLPHYPIYTIVSTSY